MNQYVMTDEYDRTFYLSKEVCAFGSAHCISTTVPYAQVKMFVDLVRLYLFGTAYFMIPFGCDR